MARKKTQQGLAQQVEQGLVTTRVQEQIIDPVSQEINRIVENANIGLEDIADEVDRGLGLAAKKMSALLENQDPEIQIKAANAIKSLASHVVQRRKLQVDTVKKIVVKFGDKVTIPNHSAEMEE